MKWLRIFWLRRGTVEPIEESIPDGLARFLAEPPAEMPPAIRPANPVSYGGRVEREVIRLFVWWSAKCRQETLK